MNTPTENQKCNTNGGNLQAGRNKQRGKQRMNAAVAIFKGVSEKMKAHVSKRIPSKARKDNSLQRWLNYKFMLPKTSRMTPNTSSVYSNI